MQFLDKWERKFGWMSFPGLLRYYALFHVLVFLLQFANPYIGKVLAFDRDKILSGELWRMVTFLVADSGFKGQGGFAILFLIFMVMIAFMMSDALEGAWGTFKTSLFYYTGFLGLLIANFIYETPMPGSGFFVYTSAFFAFATLFPKVEFLMFFILPVQVRWLAIVIGAVQLLALLSAPHYIGFLVLGFGNYLLWAGIPAMRGHAKVRENATRRKKFEGGLSKESGAFHCCVSCKRTEISNPELEFRMAEDGEEYCIEHLDS